MSPITNYDFMIDKEYPAGTLITPTGGRIHTRYNTTGGILLFGLGGVTGANFKELALPSAAGDRFEGVIVYTTTYENRVGYTQDSEGRYGYPDKREVSIVKKGDHAQMAVWVDSATAVNDPVFLRFTATDGATGLSGCFRADADTATALEIPGARFIKTVTAPAAGNMKISHIEFGD